MRRKRLLQLDPSELDPLVRERWDRHMAVRAIARELNVSLYRTEASLFRQGLNVPVTPECSQEVEEAIVSARTNDRVSIARLCSLFGLNYFRVRRILRRYNAFAGHPGKHTLCGSAHPCSKLSSEQWRQLEEDLRKGMHHAEAARKYAISRERIRQLAERFGTPTGREIQTREKSVRDLTVVRLKTEKSIQRMQRMDNKYAEWRKMWGEGVSLRDMGALFGISPKLVAVRIVQLRKRFGWFPRRNRTWKRIGPEIMKTELAAQIVDLWSRGKTIGEIAGITNNPYSRIQYLISVLRRISPSSLPMRGVADEARIASSTRTVQVLSSDPEVVAHYKALLEPKIEES